MNITNCKQCNRVFKRTYSSLCPACYEKSETLYRDMYHFLQKCAPILLTDLADRFHCTLTEVEELYYEGKFGPGAKNIIVPCYRCHRPIANAQRKGRFCLQCGENVEDATHKTVVSAVATEQNRHPHEGGHKPKPSESDHKPISDAPPEMVEETGMHLDRSSGHHFGFRRAN